MALIKVIEHMNQEQDKFNVFVNIIKIINANL
jgi:hypothetical protein